MPFNRKEYMKEYREKNKEKISQQKKEYNEKNKEKILQYSKEYYLNNKEKQAEYKKEYNKTDNGLKCARIRTWKSRGVLDNFNDNYEILYKIYLSTKFCDICNCELNTNTKTRKCLDHCHNSGYFRNIVCHSCNVKIK